MVVQCARMKPHMTVVVGVPLLGISLIVWGLWLYSGREVWTKSRKAVEVEVADELFGGTVTRTRMIEGPIGGCYVGLDDGGFAHAM